MRILSLAVLLLLLEGCDSCGAKDAAPADAAPSAPTAERRPPRRSKSSNPASAFIDAATSLDIDTATRVKIERLDDGLETDDTTAAAIFKAYRLELAAMIRANEIDDAKLEPFYADVAKNARAREEKSAVVFNQLHAALTPDQRVKVATKVKADQAARETRMLRGRRPPSAQRKILLGMTRGLELDGEQLKKVDALLPPEGADAGPDLKRAHFREVADAFEKDPFDANQLLFDEKEARTTLEDQTKLVAALLPILKEKQRDKLAGIFDETVKPGAEEPH
ncbi:MAG: hypothetical protein KIT84_37370 [Labilithrix sp.]|nr:hypothetical protein [Labilithrix sp.]MCW5816730.1 hypothetical protein [Labilithrix sp.]